MPQMCTFYKNLGTTLKFYVPEGWHTASSMQGSTNIWWYCTNFSHQGNLVPRNCASPHHM